MNKYVNDKVFPHHHVISDCVERALLLGDKTHKCGYLTLVFLKYWLQLCILGKYIFVLKLFFLNSVLKQTIFDSEY